MKFIALEVEERKEKGKSICKALRRENKFPGVIYGKNADPISVSVDSALLEKAVKDTNTMEVFLCLTIGKETYEVMLKELQVDIINGKYIHADFLVIDKDKAMDFKIPVKVVGDDVCPGIKEGGLLQTLRRELDVRCAVAKMPEVITIDISELNGGDSVHINDIDLGEGVEVVTEVNFTVVTIVSTASADAEEGDAEAEEE